MSIQPPPCLYTQLTTCVQLPGPANLHRQDVCRVRLGQIGVRDLGCFTQACRAASFCTPPPSLALFAAAVCPSSRREGGRGHKARRHGRQRDGRHAQRPRPLLMRLPLFFLCFTFFGALSQLHSEAGAHGADAADGRRKGRGLSTQKARSTHRRRGSIAMASAMMANGFVTERCQSCVDADDTMTSAAAAA